MPGQELICVHPELIQDESLTELAVVKNGRGNQEYLQMRGIEQAEWESWFW